MTLQQIYFAYKSTKSQYKKNKVLELAFHKYERFIVGKAKSLSKKFFRLMDQEDFESIIRTGIARAFTEKKPTEEIEVAILKFVRCEISHNVRQFFTKKSTLFHEDGEDCLVEDALIYEHDFNRTLIRNDILETFKHLTYEGKRIITLMLDGFSVKEIGRVLKKSVQSIYHHFRYSASIIRYILGDNYVRSVT